MKKKIKLSLNKKTISNLEQIFGGNDFIEGDSAICPTASRKPDAQSACLCGPTTDPYHTISCHTCYDGGFPCPYVSLDGCN